MFSSVQLRLLMGDPLVAPVPAAVVDSLTGLEVTTAVGSASGFQLTLAVSRRSPLLTSLLPAGFFAAKTRVVAVVAAAGRSTVLLDGVVLRHDLTPSNDPGASTLTLTGQDLTAVMDLKVRQVGYPAQSPDVQVLQICARYAQYGLVSLAVPPPEQDVSTPVVRIPVQRSTDLAYVRALGESVGYVFYVDPGPAPGQSSAYWGPETRLGPAQPALGVNLDANSTVESLSFSYDGSAKTVYTQRDVPVDSGVDVLRPPLAATPAPALRTEPLSDVQKLNTTQTQLLATSRAAGSANTVTGTGELDVLRYGHVLAARRPVGVRGTGPAHDGTYFVSSVTSQLSHSGFRQRFTLVRDGFGSLTPTVPP